MHRYFAFSLHKSGSTLFYTLLRGAARRSQDTGSSRKLNYVSIPDLLTNAGVPGKILLDPGYIADIALDALDTIYGGFRFVPGFFKDTHLEESGTMILVRDPRDMLTSLYYSVSKSHRVPGGEAGELLMHDRKVAQGMNVDQFVLTRARNQDWVERFERISSFRAVGKAWRYEDVVFNKSSWFDEILEYLDVDLPPRMRKALIERVDIVPEADRPDEHVRQVRPGDHQRKLKPETIEELNDIFSVALSTWGYST
jgi:hypothetical protein